MKVTIRTNDGKTHATVDADRVATRKSPCIDGVTEVIIYKGSQSWDFPTTICDFEIIP